MEIKEGSTGGDILTADSGLKDAKKPALEGKPDAPVYDGDIDKYKGKTFKELTDMMGDREKTITRQGTELGQLRDDVAFAERAKRFGPSTDTESAPKPEERQKDPLEGLDDDRFVKVGDVKQMVSAYVGKEQEDQKAASRERLLTAAAIAHEDGKKAGMHGPIFEGIEKEVEELVHQHYRPSVEAGYDVTQYLRDPETFKKAARYLRFQRGEYDYLTGTKAEEQETISRGPVPMTAGFAGEVPSGHASRVERPEDNISFSDKDRFIMKKFGLTEEEARTELTARRQARLGGGI